MTIAMSMRAACLATALAAVTGCTPTGGPTTVATAASPSVSQSVSPAPSPTALTPDEQDLVAAKAAYATYVKELDRLSADPESRINDLGRVARDSALEQGRKDLLTMRVAGYRLKGSTVIDGITAKLSKPNKWTLTACLDLSKSDLVDAKGKSVTGPPYRMSHRATVIRDSRNYFVTTDKVVATC